MRRDILDRYRALGLRPISGGDGSDDGGATGEQGTQQGGDGKQGQTDANAGGQQGGESGKPTFTTEQQAHIDALIGKARTEGRTNAAAEAKRKADEEAAKAKGEWEKLAGDRQKRVDELEASLKQRDHDDLRRRVAAKHKLPEALANRLTGDDEAALDADATELAKLVTPRQAPNTEVGTGQKGQTPTTSNRPMPKPSPADQQTKPVYTFDGTPKVPWPEQTRSPGTT